MNPHLRAANEAELNAMQLDTDPLADDTIARILGPWPSGMPALDAQQWQAIATVNRLLGQWSSNAALQHWRAEGEGAGRGGRAALLAALVALPGLEQDDTLLKQLANAIARAPDPLAPRQLLVDVSTIAGHDLRTGIERVVRGQLVELLRLRVPGLRVEPLWRVRRPGRRAPG
eukprot:gene36402-biopygen30949